MTRTKLCDRVLPVYSPGEECMNMVTHIVGGALGILALVTCLLKAQAGAQILCGAIYGSSMILLYAVSSIYHGLKPGTAKKVMQIIDHCTIYILIAGTYTPIVLCALAPVYPAIGWGLFAAEWIMAVTAAALTAIDLKKYRVFSMICYIGMGWGVVFFLPHTLDVLGQQGFWILFAGGIAYTVGAVLFGLGKRMKWMHSVFHIFVVLGSFLQLITVLVYVF